MPNTDNDAPEIDLPDAERVYRNYVAQCRRLGITSTPREAADALASGRMTLVCADDAAIVNEAMRTHIQRTLAKLGRSPIEQPGSSWLRIA